MGVEIERKFLVVDDSWRADTTRSSQLVQGYISIEPDRTVRVRLRDDIGVLTIKGRAEQLVRPEFEYDIPVGDARQLLDGFCVGKLVEKMRHDVVVDGHCWEVDEFAGANEGLVLAEIELDDPDEPFERPQWLGEEVTGDERYYNARLAQSPYKQWE